MKRRLLLFCFALVFSIELSAVEYQPAEIDRLIQDYVSLGLTLVVLEKPDVAD